jgi:hypothetical protein
MKSIEDRFLDKVNKDTSTGCWEWTGGTTRGDYGVIRKKVGHKKYKSIRAHRLSYELYKGSIGELNVCHTCDNPKCVNPEHLFLGTVKDNVQDKMSKGRHNYGRQSHHKWLSQEIANTIRKEKGTMQQIAEKFGTSKAQVCRIKHNQIWKGIDAEGGVAY